MALPSHVLANAETPRDLLRVVTRNHAPAGEDVGVVSPLAMEAGSPAPVAAGSGLDSGSRVAARATPSFAFQGNRTLNETSSVPRSTGLTALESGGSSVVRSGPCQFKSAWQQDNFCQWSRK